MRNNWKRLILMKTSTKILLHLICLSENASKQLISFWHITTRNKRSSRNNDTAIRDSSHYLTQNLQNKVLK